MYFCFLLYIFELFNENPSFSDSEDDDCFNLFVEFMLLENITWRFEYPCILDLKMGTRQYGDDATPAKIQSQSTKAAMTTSVQLGVRLCGMQVGFIQL